MSIEKPNGGGESDHSDSEAGFPPEESLNIVAGGRTKEEAIENLRIAMKAEADKKRAAKANNDNHGHGANDNHGHAEHAHEHPGSLLGLWGFLIAKAFKATISGASSGGGHSAPAKKADSHGGGGGGHH